MKIMNPTILVCITLSVLLSVAGCQSSSGDSGYRPIRDAPLEPGQTTFQRQRVTSERVFTPSGDAPLEPGETTFQRQRDDDGLPEPGQIMMEGSQNSEFIPEPD